MPVALRDATRPAPSDSTAPSREALRGREQARQRDDHRAARAPGGFGAVDEGAGLRHGRAGGEARLRRQREGARARDEHEHQRESAITNTHVNGSFPRSPDRRIARALTGSFSSY